MVFILLKGFGATGQPGPTGPSGQSGSLGATGKIIFTNFLSITTNCNQFKQGL